MAGAVCLHILELCEKEIFNFLKILSLYNWLSLLNFYLLAKTMDSIFKLFVYILRRAVIPNLWDIFYLIYCRTCILSIRYLIAFVVICFLFAAYSIWFNFHCY